VNLLTMPTVDMGRFEVVHFCRRHPLAVIIPKGPRFYIAGRKRRPVAELCRGLNPIFMGGLQAVLNQRKGRP